MESWNLYWSPTGQRIATVQASTAKAAKRKAPAPYRKYLGEIYATKASADARGSNPRSRQKTVGKLKAEQARLVAKLKKTPTTVDASRTIARLGDLNVAIAAAKRRDGAGKKRGRKRRSNPQGRFQIAALRGKKILFLSGVAMTDSRAAASNYGGLGTARKIARQVRAVGGPLGISKVAVVTAYDSPGEIRSFLLGEARGATGKTR
jgi:hypothetical protein